MSQKHHGHHKGKEQEAPDHREVEKTPLEKSRDVISQLKEMRHYSIENIEKIGGFWILLEDELKLKDRAEQMNVLLDHQSAFQKALEAMIEGWEQALSKGG